ncbi:MAG: C25 family cysteine peptidase [Gammaproteobacteria bacterium]|nr:C25 family cysteine peptidase [Gammaproteobacteria bacterium]
MNTTSASARCGLLRRGMAAVVLLTGMASGLAVPPAWAQEPIVNGQFYGDGDENRYPSTPYAVSENGSELYVTLVNGTLYVALVVTRTFNDNVFDSESGSAYLLDAGWGDGGNTTACRRMDSEFAEFTLEVGDTFSYTWQQGYAGQSDEAGGGNPCGRHDRRNATWISDVTVSGGGGTPPPGVESASSLMWNMNNYADSLAAGTLNWTMPGTHTNSSSWKSPWVGADGSGTPPEDPDAVTDANEGYPGSGQITYSPTYEWEWPMVYEWSVNMTQFGANPVFVVTGSSHHSPSKEGLKDDEFPPDDDPLPLMDFGDLPDSYQTLLAANGARHIIDTSVDVHLGENVDTETDGQPGPAANGDDLQTVDDEDGVFLPDGTLGEGDPAVYTATVTVTNDNGNGDAAFVCGWFDMDQDGTFNNAANTSTSASDPGSGSASEAGERSCISIPDGTIDGSFTVSWTIPVELRGNDGEFYFRFRISTDAGLLGAPSPVGVYDDGEVEDYRVSISSLPVTLNSFESRLTGSRLRVKWTTASETFNMGFNLWAQIDDAWRLLTPDPVLSEGGDAVTPQEYKLGVPLPGIDPRSIQGLALSSIGMDGGQELYGSFVVGRSYGERSLPEPIAWEAVRAELDASMRGKGYVKSANKWRRGKSGNKPGTAVASAAAPSAAEVSVTAPGMQRVTYEALRAAGLDLAGARANAIAVTLKGEGVPRVIEQGRGNGGFGPGGYIDFWGSKPDYPDALYISDYDYRIEVDAERALAADRVMRRQKTGQTVALRPVRVNEDLAYSFSTATEDPWYAAMLRYPWGPLDYTATVNVDDALAADRPGRVEVVVTARTSFPEVNPDHRIRVRVNGQVVLERKADGNRALTLTGEVPAGVLAPGGNTVTVELPGGTAAPFEIVLVDRVALWYPRALAAMENRLHVEDEVTASGLQGSGFTHSDLVGYARSDEGRLHELRVDASRARGSWTAVVPTVSRTPGVEGVEYWLSTTSGLNRPQVLGTVQEEDLLADAADFLLIVHPSFMPESGEGSHPLNRYMDRRQSQGWRVRAVALDAIQNAYGGGMALPGALTSFLAAADAAFDYSHVLLVGDDSYDYLDNLGLGSVSFVPTMYTKANVINFSPSDGLLTDLDGDGLSDKAVGRWPVRTLTDLEVMVQKTLDWEDSVSGPRDARTSVWVTDSEDPAVASFEAQAERMIGTLQTPLAGGGGEPWPAEQISRVYFDEVSAEAGLSVAQTARGELMEALSAGQTVTGFVGHGSPTAWTFQGLLGPQHVSEMDNEGRPTLITTLTCYTSYFVSPNTDTLAHRLMKGYRKDGQGNEIPGVANGAVAVHGAATLSGYTDNESLARRTLAHQLQDGDTLGEAIRKARVAAFEAGQLDTAKNWALLGDPTLTIGQ